MISKVIEILAVARMVAVALAGLSLVVIGIKYMTGSGNDDSALFKTARNVLIAAIAVWMLAPIIILGRTVADKYAWKPDKGDTGMTQTNIFGANDDDEDSDTDTDTDTNKDKNKGDKKT